MPLGFSHFPVVIRKQALLDRLALLPPSALEIAIINRLLASKFADDYLVGLDDMASEDDTTLTLLTVLGLAWHMDGDCIDYFMWGACNASWLEYECIPEQFTSGNNQPSGFWHTYRHVDDKSTKLVLVDGYGQPTDIRWD